MSTYVVSGAASGIGAATTALLRAQGHTVITVDLRDADVVADLSTGDGRAHAVDGVRAVTGVVHGVVPAAGIGGFSGTDPGLVVSVNFFGAVALVEGLRDLMVAAGGAAAGHEAVMVYPATKAALARWSRREGVTEPWIGGGIRLNSVAPGKIATAMTEQLAADPVFGPLSLAYPTALGRDGRAEEVAAPIAFLLSEAASLVVGSVLYVDGGTDAILHPISPEGWEVPIDLP